MRQTVDAGARVPTGGAPLDRPGYYYAPTVLTDIPRESPAYREELFGTVAALLRVPDLAPGRCPGRLPAAGGPFGRGRSSAPEHAPEGAVRVDAEELRQLRQRYGIPRDWSKMLISICHEHLNALVDRTGETAHFAVREGRQVFFVDHRASTRQNIVVPGHTGDFAPLYSTAHGKALLVDFDEKDLKGLLGAMPLKTYTARTIGSISELAKACAKVKVDGYIIDDGEYLEDVRCVAAPIRDKDGAIIASIGISAPQMRFPQTRNRLFGRHVAKSPTASPRCCKPTRTSSSSQPPHLDPRAVSLRDGTPRPCGRALARESPDGRRSLAIASRRRGFAR